jgi:hypothetical protein
MNEFGENADLSSEYQKAQEALLELASTSVTTHGIGSYEARNRRPLYPLVEPNGPWNPDRANGRTSEGNTGPDECLYALINLHNRLTPEKWQVKVQRRLDGAYSVQIADTFVPADESSHDLVAPKTTTPQLYERYIELRDLAQKILLEAYHNIPGMKNQKVEREQLFAQADLDPTTDEDLKTLSTTITARQTILSEAKEVLKEAIVSFDETLVQAEALSQSAQALAKLQAGQVNIPEVPSFNLGEARDDTRSDQSWTEALSKKSTDIQALIDNGRPVTINPRGRNDETLGQITPEH